MKKILISLLFICTFFITAQAESWRFVWDDSTTTIDVPLGANLQSYIYKPKAYLYRDNTKLDDAKISYVTTGDWLYLLTDVDTNKIGTYQVWYKASESRYQPGQCQGYKALITFRVYDDKSPVINSIPKQITYRVGTEKPDYLSQIIASDNSGQYNINIDDSLVNYELTGEYEVFVSVTDGTNSTMESIKVQVIDPEGPIVTFLGENNTIEIGKGEAVKISSYFKAIDKIDGDVTSSITYDDFDTNEERVFPLTVTFSDKSNNSSEFEITIKVIDKSEPIIELYSSSLVLNYLEDYEVKLKENVKRAFLGNQDISSSISIDLNNIKNEVGSYMVTYKYDSNGKVVSVDCDVKMLCDVAPIIMVENIVSEVGIKPNINDYITVDDPSDELISSKIEYDDSLVDYQTPGVYPVTVSVINSSALSSSQILYITVVSDDVVSSEEDKGIDYKLIGIVLVGGVIVGGFIFYKKKKKKAI